MKQSLENSRYSKIFARPELPFYLILWSTVFLAALGLTMVLSASTVTSLQENGNSYSIFMRQFFFLIIGTAAAYWAYKVRGTVWLRIAKISLTVSILTLLLPFVSFLGKDVKGNLNWVEFWGFTLQPSEFAKFGLILWCAYQLKNIDLNRDGTKSLFVLLPAIAVIASIILLQKDLGTALLILLIFIGILFIAGAPLKLFLSVFVVGIVIGSAFVFSSAYRMNRFAALFDPFDEKYYKFSGWQPAHSIMGLASGGLWGSGLGASKQKWANLAEAHTDFIFSVIGEELGLLGSLLVLGLYSALIYAIVRVALKTKDNFSRYATAAIACWFIAQVTINIGSATSLIPVIGVTLPFISYGGSSLLANLLAVGFVLGVARRTPEIAYGIKANQIRRSTI
ncbi:MAG: cell division protein [Actinobacteria bacterium BACL4 MAG-120820-bin23]|jgi:cell division protein FtsW|uniref:putative lipid II flippase FtsW n=1 Tax=Candidatus Nanopelagicus sp. TaxID=2518620 RepID=UPI0007142F1A|nr:MAG: cell division protein [Actinobacteria bacterium BACL4 MAG-121022-bin9]KRO45997.1 MAG: cell division protein [Actinobacteria bacterium BACL4 MAG-120813-bin39]KRO50624.1 MAG: cell division protein [Actinobacteria bacterium BACL4 MAG-120820-bin23]KRO51547.1 MAG: cell division protein [Actinobacteria bacterium BACL4 MAG-121001-bin59]KRO77425.1 MAG: cell division protein [Actinobacteria bacterium BACL4 MAG-120920-bin74]KRO93037.1 MAG: cell division protein [Actinobacteria bacterium BACL4 MA